MNKHYWPAIVLILVGAVLLLHQTDLIDFTWADLLSYGSIAIGIILLVNCFNRTDRKGILGGVFFTVFGVSMLLMREYILPRADEFGFAMFFIALALGNFAYLPFKKDKTNNLVFGGIFAVVGILLMWAYFGYYPSWYIWEGKLLVR